MNIITIDCGASFLKGALFSDKGKILKRIDKKSPVVHRDEPIVEPIQIRSLMKAVRQLIRELIGNHEEAVLGISNEMHGFVLADDKGTPITDYISWQKEYGGSALLQADIFKDEIKKTGMPERDGLPSSNLLYLIKSEIISNNEKTYFLTLGDYIIFSLSGQVPNCHPTNAAATGLYDIAGKEWNKKFISMIGADFIHFPKIGNSILQFELDGKTIYAFPAIGDQQAALLGAGMEKEDDISFNLGTGAQVSILISDINFFEGSQIRPYFYGKYLKTIPHLPSGRAINVYFRFVKDIAEKFGISCSDDEIWNLILGKIENASDTNIKCDMSFFDNAVTSYNKGSITEIGEYDFTIDKIMKAVINTMVNNFIWAADRICGDRSKINRIIFSGGIARKISYLRDKIIDEYSDSVSVEIAENETLYGLYKYIQFVNAACSEIL